MVKGIRTPLDTFVNEVGDTLNYERIVTLPRDIPYKTMPRQNSPSNKEGVKLDTMSEESLVVLKKK